jgi:multicomponent Na+:H+ antiporter subunit E
MTREAAARPARIGRRRRGAAGRRGRLSASLSLAVLWLCLWGDVSWANVVGGLLAGLFAVSIFPLAPLGLRGRLHPIGAARFVAHFVRDLIVSSVQVAAAAFLPRRRLYNAIVAVQLQVVSDLNIALTSVAVTLVPGSLVMDASREDGVLFIHLLNVRDEEHLERLRQGVAEVEWRVVHAIGSPPEVRRIEWLRDVAQRRASGTGPAQDGGAG